jgi:hypothetical protein
MMVGRRTGHVKMECFHSFVRNRHHAHVLRMSRILVLLLFPVFLATAQSPLDLEFNVTQLREEFSEENANWTYMTTVENLYMPDKGDLFMHRNNPNSAYAFVTKWQQELRVFSILSRLKLGPAESTEQTIGIICLVQRDGKGAVVVEFNKFRQYRVKQLVGSYYRYVSGNAENKGWEKSALLRGKEEYNDLEVRVSLPQVDVYLNGKFAMSFDVPDYTPGMMGLLIGPDTKAKADYFYVSTTQAELDRMTEVAEEKGEVTTPTEVITKLRYELEMKDRELKECRSERVKAVSTLEERVGTLTAENDRLSLQVGQLAEFRDQVLVDIDEDAFLTVARSLKDEIIRSGTLERQLQVYRDSLRLTHEKYAKLKLALLDKSIKKAEQEKVEREKEDAAKTKKEIEAELMDTKLRKEQEEWERKQREKAVPAKVEAKSGEVLPIAPAQETASVKTAGPSAKPSPMPIPVRRATRKTD